MERVIGQEPPVEYKELKENILWNSWWVLTFQ